MNNDGGNYPDIKVAPSVDDDFLTAYQQDYDCSNAKRRERSKAQANFCTISVLKQYRRTLQPRKVPFRSLVVMMIIPVDILFEILQYLHPVDLFHLKNMNADFRVLLENSSSNSVWKSVFDNFKFSNIPLIPSDVPPSKWADLLFGAMICEDCGGSNAPANIPFRRRLCFSCSTKQFAHVSDFLEEDPEGEVSCLITRRSKILFIDPFCEYGWQELDLIWPQIDRTEWAEVSAALSLHKKAVEKKVKDAEGHLAWYKSTRLAFNAQAGQENCPCINWVDAHNRSHHQDSDERAAYMINRIRTRFKALNYVDEDVENAYFELDYMKRLVIQKGFRQLTRRRWEKIRPTLEPAICKAGEERQRREREKLLESRFEFIKDGYRKYMSTTLPATWAYVPPVSAVRDFKFIADLINTSHDSPLVEEDLVEPFKLLPGAIEEWKISKIQQLAMMLPLNQRVDVDDDSMEEPEADISALDLATSVFHCLCLGSIRNGLRVGACLIGWDGAGPHLRCLTLERYWDNKLHFSARGYDAAAALVELAGLDPKTTKIWDMDALDPRFVCMTCPLETSNTITGQKVWDWREAVFHYISTEETHATPSYGILARHAEADIKAREEPDPCIGTSKWSCNHCSEHFSRRVPRRTAVAHVRDVHDIAKPVHNLDYVYIAGGSQPRRMPILLPGTDPRAFACLQCAATKTRLYNSKVIKLHLKDAHRVKEPVEGEDWKKVMVVLRSTVQSVSRSGKATEDS